MICFPFPPWLMSSGCVTVAVVLLFMALRSVLPKSQVKGCRRDDCRKVVDRGYPLMSATGIHSRQMHVNAECSYFCWRQTCVSPPLERKLLALPSNPSVTTLTPVTFVMEQIKKALEGMMADKAKIAHVLGANDKVKKEKRCM